MCVCVTLATRGPIVGLLMSRVLHHAVARECAMMVHVCAPLVIVGLTALRPTPLVTLSVCMDSVSRTRSMVLEYAVANLDGLGPHVTLTLRVKILVHRQDSVAPTETVLTMCVCAIAGLAESRVRMSLGVWVTVPYMGGAIRKQHDASVISAGVAKRAMSPPAL